MQTPRGHRDPRRSRSVSKSPLPSPSEECGDPLRRQVAFVPFEAGTSSGVSNETRRAVRVQAAKASAAARKRTIARRLAEKQGSAAVHDEAASPSAPEGEGDQSRSRRTSAGGSSASAVGSDSPRIIIATSPSPSRSLSSTPVNATFGGGGGGGGSSSSSSYPGPQWHNHIPQLVEYFTRHFLPDPVSSSASSSASSFASSFASSSASSFASSSSSPSSPPDMAIDGRDALRTHLWPVAMRETCLFNAILLLAASHATVTRALSIPPSLLSQLKNATIETINDAIAKSESNVFGDAAVGAIALLGAWELEYGTASAYDTHMGGLNAIINNVYGGLVGARAVLSPAIINVVLAVDDLALYHPPKRPFFEPSTAAEYAASTTLHSTLPMGFEELRAQRVLLPSLMHLLARLDIVNPHDLSSRGRIDDTEALLEPWDIHSTHTAPYSSIRTVSEDVLVRQVSLHLRIAGLALCSFLRYASTTNVHELLEGVYNEAYLLQPEHAVGTIFEEVTLWCLIVVCSASGRCEPKHMRTIKRLCLELGISHWEDLRTSLARYVYPATLLDSRVFALWEAVRHSTIARDSHSGVSEINRYTKGTQHPTTYVGAVMVADDS